MDEALLGLGLALSFLFGWNNSSFLIGNIRGSGSLPFRASVTLSVVGLLAGALFEGSKMTNTLSGSLITDPGFAVLGATLLVSLVLSAALTLLKLPVSFSMVMAAAFLGSGTSEALQVNVVRSEAVVAFWFLAPVLAALITFAVYAVVTRFVSGYGLLTVDSLNRAGAVVSALAVSYTLGANNIGLIYGAAVSVPDFQYAEVLLLTLAVAAVLGVLTFGRGALGGTVGDKMLALTPQGVFSAFVASSAVVWVGTQLALPVSISQCLLGGMLGAAYTKEVTILNRKLVGETVSLWVVAPVAAFFFGYALVPFL